MAKSRFSAPCAVMLHAPPPRDPVEHHLRKVEAHDASTIPILGHLPADDASGPLVGKAAFKVDVLVIGVVEALVGRDRVAVLPLAALGEDIVSVDGARARSKLQQRDVVDVERLVAHAEARPAEEVRLAIGRVHRVQVEDLPPTGLTTRPLAGLVAHGCWPRE